MSMLCAGAGLVAARGVAARPVWSAMALLIFVLVLDGAVAGAVLVRSGRVPVGDPWVRWPVEGSMVAAMTMAGAMVAFHWEPARRSDRPWLVVVYVVFLAVPIACGVAALHRRWERVAVARLVTRIASPATAAAVRAAFAEALHDRSAVVLYRLSDEGGYVDDEGMDRNPADRSEGRVVFPVETGDGEVFAVLEVAAASGLRREAIGAAIAAGRPALENAQLQAVLNARLAQVRSSRRRIVAAAVDARRRFEQDLHDGAQRRLLAVAARLGLARVRAKSAATVEAIDGARVELQGALRELRNLARGIFPAALAQDGLRAGLDTLSDGLPLLIDLQAPPDRFDDSVETAAYLTVSEILTLAATKTAAERASVAVYGQEDQLHIDMTHDGMDGLNAAYRSELSLVADRLRALGGDLRWRVTEDEILINARMPCG
jgi:signal transduction histidine kinase